MSEPIPYDPNCLHCRRDAGKDSAGVTRLCETHKADEIARLQREVAEAHSDVAHLNLDRLTVMARALTAERERDEARDEIERLNALWAAEHETVMRLGAERDEARAQVERLERERDGARAEIKRLRTERDSLAARVLALEVENEKAREGYAQRAYEAERERDEAVALLREIAEDGQCPLCDLSDGAHDVGCRLYAFLAGGQP